MIRPLPCLVLLLAPLALASEAPAEEPLDAAAFAEAVATCTVAAHQSPHPFIKGFTIDHAVGGMDGETCRYSQTMPGEMRMECALTEAGQAGLSAEYRQQAAGRMSGGTGKQPDWTADCELVAKDGKRTPMSGG